jgi:hypothetical protein
VGSYFGNLFGSLEHDKVVLLGHYEGRGRAKEEEEQS